MRLAGLALAGVAGLATLVGQAALGQAAPGPIMIERQGAFSVGGTVAGDPANASLHCDHGTVEYQIPTRPRAHALFLWHSSAAQVWQSRWDGGEGFQSIFLRRNWPVYLWDGPRVGRGNWGCVDYTYRAVMGRDQQNVASWRFGPAAGQWFDGVQFPTQDPAALDQALRARYDEFDTPANAHLEAEAGAMAMERIGPTVVVTNSAGGWRALLAALKTPNIKAIVAYENPGYVFPDGEGPQGAEGPFGPTHVPLAQFVALTRIPMQFVWGDNVDKSPVWSAQYRICEQFVAIVNRHGGKAEILRLPDVGLSGNTHMAMADLNNLAVADQLSLFLKRQGLARRQPQRRR